MADAAPPAPSAPPTDPVIKWGVLIGFFIALAVWVYSTLTGQTTAPPPPVPPLPITQTIPPGHTAFIETDAAGRVQMSVAPSRP